MASRSVQPKITEVDPRFNIPEGADAFKYAEVIERDDVEVVFDSDYVYTEESAPPAGSTTVPYIIGVVTQTVRTTSTGNQVIDLVLEISPVSGIENYEFKVAKG